MKMSDNKAFIIFTAIIFVPVIIFIIWGLRAWNESLKIHDRPEQREQVEVVGKRIREISSDPESSGTNYYIVAFKFPDSSPKELTVGFGASYKKERRRVYDSIQEGDTGILTYKEIENIEGKYKNEENRYNGRFFISFEKNPECGGLRIETLERSERTSRMQQFGLLVLILLGFITIGFVLHKVHNTPKQYAQVSVMEKRTHKGETEDYIVSFKFPDGLTREFFIGYNLYNSIHKGDTGTLAYTKYSFINFEKDPEPND